jgi:hypothetical protein
MSTNFLIEYNSLIDKLFLNDKRGRQYFLINTNGFKNFDMNQLNENSLYSIIRKELENNDEYKEFKNTFLNNINVIFNKSNKNYSDEVIGHKNDIEDAIQNISKLNNFLFTIDDINKFIETNLNDSYLDKELITTQNNTESFKYVDKYIYDRIKNSWKQYTEQQYNSKNLDDIVTNDLNPECQKCNDIMYEFLLTSDNTDNNESNNNLLSCINTINNILNNDNLQQNDFSLINIDLVLTLLHRFGFKTTTINDQKIIISVNDWINMILPTLKLDKTLITVNLQNYLQKLVDYINSQPHILNYSLDNINNGLYFKKINSITNFSDILRNLIVRFSLKTNNALISGGYLYDDFNNSNINLLNEYNKIKSELKNVKINDVDDKIIIKNIQKMNNKKEKILNYLKFINESNLLFNLFKYAPSKSSPKYEDINKLNLDIASKIDKYHNEENKIYELLQSLIHKEQNPNDNDDVFTEV